VHYDVSASRLGQWPPIISQFITVVSSVNSWLQDGRSIALSLYYLSLSQNQKLTCSWHICWHVESYNQKKISHEILIYLLCFNVFFLYICWNDWIYKAKIGSIWIFKKLLFASYTSPIKFFWPNKITFLICFYVLYVLLWNILLNFQLL